MAEKTLIETFIADQQRLTAVERFAQEQDSGELVLPTRRFRDLLPATAPSSGEQYAFEVNLDACSGCKACVTACHSLNGLDENETWREVGLLIPEPKRRRSGAGEPLPAGKFNGVALAAETRVDGCPATTVQHVTTACHHCVDAACLNGCPVLAYDKDPLTGIVRHLDDQCIGCQYCVLKCPYDVPKCNARLGIVRKCDMCSNRLAVGEAPACVQACPNGAIRITTVQTEPLTIEFRERAATFLTGAPSGDYTLPTTRYISALPAMEDSAEHSVAADHALVKPQPPHWPLIFMLVLTQGSVGACMAAVIVPNRSTALLGVALALVTIGLGASVFHLGRPFGAWRGFLNVRRSWMSREIVMFGAYPGLLGAALFLPKLCMAAAITGAVAVFCSAMIYVDTRRELWARRRTLPLFFGSAALLGAASALIFLPATGWVAGALAVVTVSKLAVEVRVVRHVTDNGLTAMRKSALLITSTFGPIAMLRVVLALTGGIGLPLLLGSFPLRAAEWFAAAAFGLLILGELCERYLFFRCVVAPKMPGGLPT